MSQGADHPFYASSEYLLVEQRRHSKERRRFLLFSAFDFSLITILWIIFTVTKSPDWRKDFTEQCNIGNAKFFLVSLFDIAILAFFRFVWLLTWYAFVSVNHWWPVGLSTGLSTIFLLTKVVYFFLETSNQTNNPLAYAIPICSFVTAWVELYLLDVQVLPNERAENLVQQSTSSGAQRRHLRHGPGRLPRTTGGAVLVGHASDYRTATELSSDDSETEGDEESNKNFRRIGRLMKELNVVYRTYGRSELTNVAKKAMTLCKNFYESVDTWALKKSSPLIRSNSFDEYGRYFYLKFEAKISVEGLFDLLYNQCHSMPQWNNLILDAKIVMRVDDFTDVMYSISAPALKNYISSRDFLDVRYFEQHGRTYYIATMFIRSDLRPPVPNSKLVRGENGPSLCILKPSQVNEGSSTLEWIMNTNLKGNLPKKLVDNSLVQFLCRFADRLENKLKTM